MESFLFKRIELWIVLLIILIGAFISVLFGWSVRHYQLGNEKLGKFGEMAYNIASFPTNAKNVFKTVVLGRSEMAAESQRFQGESGFNFSYRPGERPDLGYLMLSRFDGDSRISVAELVDLDSQKIVYEWRFDVSPLWEMSTLHTQLTDLKVDLTTDRFRNFHSYLAPDGHVLTTSFSPLIKTDSCSNLSLLSDAALYHHSLEIDADGNFWFPLHIEPKTVLLGSDQFKDDGIAKLSPDGTVLFKKSLSRLFEENGLGYLLYGLADLFDDPIHLNDIQPVLEDGPFWKKGDLFLSLRHQSMIMLYRPDSDQIIWYKAGPWVHQHDVDILDDHRIAVFNNNSKVVRKNEQVIADSNNEIIYDFDTGRTSEPFRQAFHSLEIQTIWEGRGEILDSGDIFVEETENGRVLQFNQEAKIIWQFINRASDNKLYLLSWSRLIPRSLGDKVLENAKREKCNAH